MLQEKIPNKYFSDKNFASRKGAVPKVMSVALIELVEMTATLNVVVSINSTTVMQTYWTASGIEKFLFCATRLCNLSIFFSAGEVLGSTEPKRTPSKLSLPAYLYSYYFGAYCIYSQMNKVKPLKSK